MRFAGLRVRKARSRRRQLLGIWGFRDLGVPQLGFLLDLGVATHTCGFRDLDLGIWGCVGLGL